MEVTGWQQPPFGFIKHVLSAALDHARLPEPFSSKAILELHDAVELFVHLIAEQLGATMSKKADFLEYWPAIKEKLGATLPAQSAMKRLNQARVGLKHSGIRPSRDEIEDLTTKTITFFDESCRLVFGVPLEALSSVGLIGYEPAASRLRYAEQLTNIGDLVAASQMCALAFDEIMDTFHSKAGDKWRRSPFPRLSEITHFRGVHLGYEWSKENKGLAAHLEKVSAAFSDIEPVLLMLALGIEYRQFAKFKKVTPYVDGMMDGSSVVGTPKARPSERDIMFATDFVTQAALRLRELDPDPPRGTSEQPFRSEPAFAVTLPPHDTAPERAVTGRLTEIGSGFEAWIFHGDHLARAWRGKGRDAAVAYLNEYREDRIRDGGKEFDASSSNPTGQS
jgi:hypothetical protein